VFGVTLDSTVTGEASMAVPVGQTLDTPDRTPRPPAPPQQAVTEGPPAFAPVPDSFVAQMPLVLEKDPREKEGDGTAVFPPEAKRLGLEGQVVMRVGIDRHGVVRSVRVVKKAGYGFDEAASQSIRRYKFSPARTNDGRPVDFLITFKYTFGRRE
jgi:TonB family protein